MPWNPEYYQNKTNTGLAARAQRDAAKFNLKLKLKKTKKKVRAQARKRQAPRPKDGHKNFFWPTIPTRRDA